MYVTGEEIKWSKIRGKIRATERAVCTNPFAWKIGIIEFRGFSAMTLHLDGQACYCDLLSRCA
jgi:hypothetical protein